MTATLMDSLDRVPIVGILRRCPLRHVERIARAAAAGGLLAIEVTMDSERAPEQIQRVCAAVAEHVVVGAGTVRTTADVDDAAAAGAGFLVAPGFDPAIVEHGLGRHMAMVPGVMTPSEASAAAALLTAAGQSPICKLFPAGVLGVPYLRALREPLSDVRWICTGGIGSDDVAAFLDAGATAIGLGGSLFPLACLSDGDAGRIEVLVRQVVARITS